MVWGQLLFCQAKTSAPSIWQMLFPSGSIRYPLLYRSEVYPTCLLGWSQNFSFLSCSTLTDICVSILKTTLAVKQQKCRIAVRDDFKGLCQSINPQALQELLGKQLVFGCNVISFGQSSLLKRTDFRSVLVPVNVSGNCNARRYITSPHYSLGSFPRSPEIHRISGHF